MLHDFNSDITLTAYWLNESFECKHPGLDCKKIEGSHTGYNTCENIKKMLKI